MFRSSNCLAALLLTLAIFLSDVSLGQGVYIYKPNAARSDSSARAGNYLSYRQTGATTKVVTESGKILSITKFQPALFLANVDPYKHGIIRVRNLAGFEATYEKYLKAYNKYTQSRPYLQSQVKELKKVIDHLKAGEGYYDGAWMADKSIDDALALKEQAKLSEKRKNALAYLPRLTLSNGKVYKNVTVKKKLYNKISFSHESGASSAKYDQLPSSLRKKLGEFKVEAKILEAARIASKAKAEAKRTAEKKRIAEEERVAEAKLEEEADLRKVKLYTKHANNGVAKYQCKLGEYYLGKDPSKSLDWYEMAANQGDEEAKLMLASLYNIGVGVGGEQKTAFTWLLEAAQQGHAEAQFRIGGCYLEGLGVEKDLQKAFAWFSKSALQNQAEAQLALAVYYSEGLAVAADLDLAVSWLSKASDQGLAEAQFMLGVWYGGGFGVEKDLNKMVELMAHSAKQGFAPAQSQLALAYSEGQGVEKDNKKSIRWYLAAAKQGNAHAQSSLGDHYLLGRGVEKDHLKAFEWYSLAAEQGYSQAQFMLGGCYTKGFGVTTNYSKANQWYSRAAKQGHIDAQKIINARLDSIPRGHCGCCGEKINSNLALEKHLTLHVLAISTGATTADDVEMLSLYIDTNGVSSIFNGRPSIRELQAAAMDATGQCFYR